MLLQERRRCLEGNAFIKDGARGDPYSNSQFQQLVAQIHGANQEIRAPVLAFIAYKLGKLLADPAWNVCGQKTDERDAPGRGYMDFLDMAIRFRDRVISPKPAAGELPGTWLRIVHNTAVSDLYNERCQFAFGSPPVWLVNLNA